METEYLMNDKKTQRNCMFISGAIFTVLLVGITIIFILILNLSVFSFILNISLFCIDGDLIIIY